MAYSYVEFEADGVTSQFPFTFPYIEQSHIKVYLDGVQTQNFTFANAGTIQLNMAPADGVIVKVVRDTPKGSRLVNFTNVSMLRESTLDKDSNHLFFVMQEVYDSFQDLLPVIDTIGSLLEYGAASLGSNTFNGDQTINGAVTCNSVSDAQLNNVTIGNYGEAVVNVVATAGSVALDLSQGNVFVVGPSAEITLSFTNPKPVCSFSVAIDEGASYTVNWPASVLWPGGVPPTLSEFRDILIFFTYNGGTTWYGSMALDALQ